MSATVADEFPPLLLTDCGPGDALLRRLKLQPLGLGVRRIAIALAAVGFRSRRAISSPWRFPA